MTFLSLNHVSLFGRVADVPTVTPIGRVRALTLGVETDDDGVTRVHRVVIQDEFLASAMQGQLVAGAAVQVLGELDYDDLGAFVSVTQRRGSDVHVLPTGQPAATARPAATQPRPSPQPAATSQPAQVQEPARQEAQPTEAAPTAQPTVSPRPAPPTPAAGPAATTAAASPSPAPRPTLPQGGAGAATAGAPPPRRPAFPAAAPSMPPAPRPAPPRPAGGALSGLQSGKTAQVDDGFPGDAPSASHSAPARSNGVKGPTGPDSLDDDIPF